jgi:hypothetical protein
MLQSEQMDWEADAEYQGVQRRLSDLLVRAKEIENRTAQLQQEVPELEQQRIQVRANMLLGEAVDKDASALEKALAHKRQELYDLEGERAVTSLALETLKAGLQQAEIAAKIQVGKQFADAYCERAAALDEAMKIAVEKNEEVDQLYRLASKQNLLPALAGDPAQKVLLRNVAVTYLNRTALKDWRTAASPILQEKTDKSHEDSKSRRIT